MIRAVSILLSLISLMYASAHEEKVLIGQHAHATVIEGDLEYLARIDTGAGISSLHALNISIQSGKSLIFAKKIEPWKGSPVFEKIENESYGRDIGSIVEFDTLNEKGEQRHLSAPVIKVTKVKNAQGNEYRYVIRLGIKYRDITKYKEVNLRDRSEMRYKLLLGRNWLADDFLVDTGRGD